MCWPHKVQTSRRGSDFRPLYHWPVDREGLVLPRVDRLIHKTAKSYAFFSFLLFILISVCRVEDSNVTCLIPRGHFWLPQLTKVMQHAGFNSSHLFVLVGPPTIIVLFPKPSITFAASWMTNKSELQWNSVIIATVGENRSCKINYSSAIFPFKWQDSKSRFTPFSAASNIVSETNFHTYFIFSCKIIYVAACRKLCYSPLRHIAMDYFIIFDAKLQQCLLSFFTLDFYK